MCQGTEEELLGEAQWYFPLIIRSMRGPIIIVEIVTIKNQKCKDTQKRGGNIEYVFIYVKHIYSTFTCT